MVAVGLRVAGVEVEGRSEPDVAHKLIMSPYATSGSYPNNPNIQGVGVRFYWADDIASCLNPQLIKPESLLNPKSLNPKPLNPKP